MKACPILSFLLHITVRSFKIDFHLSKRHRDTNNGVWKDSEKTTGKEEGKTRGQVVNVTIDLPSTTFSASQSGDSSLFFFSFFFVFLLLHNSSVLSLLTRLHFGFSLFSLLLLLLLFSFSYSFNHEGEEKKKISCRATIGVCQESFAFRGLL